VAKTPDGNQVQSKQEISFHPSYQPIDFLFLNIQLAIIVMMVIFQMLIQNDFLGHWDAPFTVSAWFLGASVAYYFNRNNEIINSLVLSGLMELVFVFGSNIANGDFLDFQHFLIIITALHIISTKKNFNFVYVTLGTIIANLWIWTVYLLGVAYQYYTITFVYALTLVASVNILFFFALSRRQTEKVRQRKRYDYPKIIGQGVFFLVLTTAIIFLLAGRINYWQGWLYFSISIISLLGSSFIFSRKSESIKEQFKNHPVTEWWDKVFHIIHFPTFFAVITVASLDAGRFHWTSEFPVFGSIIGGVILVIVQLSREWLYWRTITEEKPYLFNRQMRSISITGFLIGLGTSLILGSLWALIPLGVFAIFLILNLLFERK
jgi:hypothetical protein